MATFIFLALFAVMWIVLIVPRQRELRRHTALMGQLAVDDEVMTGSGIYGVIRAIEDDHVMLEVAEGMQLKVAKRAVAAKVASPEGSDEIAVDGPSPRFDATEPVEPDRQPGTAGS